MRNKAEEIAIKARNSISSYCINTCKSKCCKTGKLLIESEESLNLLIENTNEVEIEKREDNKFLLNLEKNPCPKLSNDNLCQVHKNEKRPRICSDYPLFLSKKYIISADSCEAVREKLLDKYIKEIEDEGYIHI